MKMVVVGEGIWIVALTVEKLLSPLSLSFLSLLHLLFSLERGPFPFGRWD